MDGKVGAMFRPCLQSFLLRSCCRGYTINKEHDIHGLFRVRNAVKEKITVAVCDLHHGNGII